METEHSGSLLPRTFYSETELMEMEFCAKLFLLLLFRNVPRFPALAKPNVQRQESENVLKSSLEKPCVRLSIHQ